MTTFRFKYFAVYSSAKALRKRVRLLLKELPSQERYRLVDQIERATLSIILNIAEGSAKQSDKEFARFLETSVASANEVAAAFDCAFDDGYITQEDNENIEKELENIIRQLGGFIKKLKVNC
ncbi:MAG: four helix bundle protein [Candidatus Peregrinibacteria bacterium]|nr:four helix bundle protein [Candidatus Peregrinibacteria bacterium]MCB9807844.1 four helix bundle protein [Candidatus Peribacteria bacterium]